MRVRLPSAGACVAVGALCVVSSVAGLASAHADSTPGSGFEALSLLARATGFSANFDEAAGQPDGAATGSIPFAESSMTVSQSHAIASVGWPGATVGNAGSLIRLLNPCAPASVPQPPTGPVCVPSQVIDVAGQLNDPVRAESFSSGPSEATNSLPGATMTSTANDVKATSEAIIGGAENAPVGTVGTTHTSSSVELTGATSAVADTYSSVQDININSGAITIGSVTSIAHATTDGLKAKGAGKTFVVDMAIGGQPVTVDGTGIHIAGQGGSPSPAIDGVNTVLANFGIHIYFSEPRVTEKGGTVTYDAGTLVITSDPGASKHTVIYSFGGAHVIAAASNSDAVHLPTVDLPPPPADSGVSPSTTVVPEISVGPSINGTEPAPAVVPQQNTPRVITFAGDERKLPTGTSPAWFLLALIGVAVAGKGLWAFPDRTLAVAAAPCPLEGNS